MRPSRRAVRTWLCCAGLQRSCRTHPLSLASRLIRAMIISSCWRARAARKRSFPATGTCTTSWIRYRQCCCLALSSVVSRRNQRRFVSPRWLQAGPIDAHEARRGLRRELPPGRPGHTCSCALRWPRRLLASATAADCCATSRARSRDARRKASSARLSSVEEHSPGFTCCWLALRRTYGKLLVTGPHPP